MHPWILAQVPSPVPATGAAPVVTPGAPAATGPAHIEAGTMGAGTQSATQGSASQPDAPKDSGWFNPIMLLPLGVLVYFLMTRGRGKEEKKVKAQLAAMKKGDEVVTIGGLVGKIIDVKEDRITIKIDESANVKAVYLKSAISRVITPEDKEKADDKK